MKSSKFLHNSLHRLAAYTVVYIILLYEVYQQVYTYRTVLKPVILLAMAFESCDSLFIILVKLCFYVLGMFYNSVKDIASVISVKALSLTW